MTEVPRPDPGCGFLHGRYRRTESEDHERTAGADQPDPADLRAGSPREPLPASWKPTAKWNLKKGTQAFGPCTTSSSNTPPGNLAHGGYTLRLHAQDVALNETEDTREFIVDTTAPETTITSAPPSPTDNATPTIAFTSSEGGSTFQCRYDAEAFRACSGPGDTDTRATALSNGAHTFQVRAIDGAGNADGTPATATFTVLTTGPQTSINSGPEGGIGGTEATFTYSTNVTASIECRLDGAAFASCPTTSKAYTGLAQGEHVFEVRGKTTVADPTPARRAIVVDTSAPSTPILSGPIFEEDGYGLHFQVEATDGSPTPASSRRSGVESVQILLAGEVVMELGRNARRKSARRASCATSRSPGNRSLPLRLGQVSRRGRKTVSATSPPRPWKSKRHSTTRCRPPKGPGAPGSLGRRGVRGRGKFGLQSALQGNGTILVGSCSRDVLTKVPASVTVIEGRGGNDVLIAGENTKTIEGGEGNDIIRGGDGNDELFGQGDDDHIYGGNGDDKLRGNAGTDVLDGGPGGDVDNGGDGADTLRGGQGPDHLNGAGGEDTASFADAMAPGFAEGETNETHGTVGRPAKFKNAKQEAKPTK